MEQIEYTRTVVPSSMRSSYWKYFGFPSDNGNNILTRQKIVCTLCNTAIAYNKNTSNLRTHLMAKHPDTFQKLLTNKRSSSHEEEEDELENDNKSNIKIKRSGCEADAVSAANVSDVKIFEAATEEVTKQHITDIRCEINDFQVSENENQQFSHVNIVQYQQPDHQQSLDMMLADMVQKDMLSLNMIRDEGFRTFSQLVSGLTVDNETYQQVAHTLRQRIALTKNQITNNVQQLSQITPYSLSVENYKNNDDLTILNIYFNFLNENQSQINGVLYHSSIVGEQEINIMEILKDVNLSNCKCIVINDLANASKEIIDFAQSYDMEIIECLASTLEQSLKKIFDLTYVSQRFLELYNKVQKYFQAMEPPQMNIQCPWSKLNWLAFVYENIEDTKWDTFCQMKLIYEYIKPLKIALDIISDEQLPICTLTRPLVIKLFEQNFMVIQTDDTLRQIQLILEKKLKNSIEQSSFLREATYFDARFRHEFSSPNDPPFDLNSLKLKVMERFKNILQIHYISRSGSDDAAATATDQHNGKKSNLKAFFDNSEMGVSKKIPLAMARTNVDGEFEHYHIGMALDLDKCPVKWWQDHLTSYPELNKIVSFYLSTPCCCVHRLFRLTGEQRCQTLYRRKQLNYYCEIERDLWYLHYNDLK